MRLTDHVTLNFNNNLSMTAVFLDFEKASDSTWHSGLLYKLLKQNVSFSTVKLIRSFLSNRRIPVSVEGELSTPREIQAVGYKVPSCPTYCIICTWFPLPPKETPGTYVTLFVDDASIYVTNRKQGYIIRKLQRGLASMKRGVSVATSTLMITFRSSISLVEMDR